MLWTTWRLVAGATVWASFLGVIAATAIHWVGKSGGLWRLLCPLPLLWPPTVIAVGWMALLGRSGAVNQWWMKLSGSEEPLFNIFSEFGCVFVWGLCWFPLVALPTLVGLRALGDSALTAGRLHAGPLRRFWRITLPLLLPYVAVGAAAVAWLTISDFDVPACLLLQTNVFPTEIYCELSAARPENIPLLCLPLLWTALGVLVLRQILVRRETMPTMNAHWRPPESCGATSPNVRLAGHLAALLIFVPSVFIPAASLMRLVGEWKFMDDAIQAAGDEVLRSVAVAAVAAGLMLVLGGAAAAALSRASGRMRLFLAVAATLPLAVPGPLHGLGWQALLSGTETTRMLLESPMILAFASAGRYAPLAVFFLAAAHAAVHRRVDDAACISGAGFFRRLLFIHAPLLFPAYLGAFFICYALALGENAAAILVHPLGFATLPIRLSSLLHFGKDQLVASLCLIQMVLVLVPFAAVTLLTNRILEIRLE
jgi:iron(III) transport system permease protein